MTIMEQLRRNREVFAAMAGQEAEVMAGVAEPWPPAWSTTPGRVGGAAEARTGEAPGVDEGGRAPAPSMAAEASSPAVAYSLDRPPLERLGAATAPPYAPPAVEYPAAGRGEPGPGPGEDLAEALTRQLEREARLLPQPAAEDEEELR